MNMYMKNGKEAANLKGPLVSALRKLLKLNLAVWPMAKNYPELEKRGLGICDTLQETIWGPIPIGTGHISIIPLSSRDPGPFAAHSQKVSISFPLGLPEPAQRNLGGSRAFPGLDEDRGLELAVGWERRTHEGLFRCFLQMGKPRPRKGTPWHSQ